MAPRSIWKGTMGFGMVSVPCKLYPATEEKTVHFNNIHRDCQTRIQMPRWCPKCDRKVDTKELVKGYEVGENQWVLMEETDFAAVPLKSLKTIEVVEFVDGSKIDPRHYDKAYFVTPEDAGVKAFSLFLQAMAKVNMVGVVRLGYREREHLATIQAFGGVILLRTLYYADELRPASDVQVKLPEVSEREMQMAITLIKTLATDTVDLTKFHDQYRDALMQVIQAKLAGQPITVQAVPEEKPMDLVDALMASINASQKAKEPAGVA
jgi:DNA end-binding protein Ku